MYPDTDSPPIPLENDYIEKLSNNLPLDVFKRFEQKLREVKQASPKDQIVKWIHGKQFFREKVHPVLNNFLGQIDTQKRLEDIFKTRDLPDDLEPLWSRIKP
jgi:Glu-tRNA(Gln) amidotransferase subunit E-like FAD-binding protein